MGGNEKMDTGNLISHSLGQQVHDLCFASQKEMRQRCMTVGSAGHAVKLKRVYVIFKDGSSP